jgi:hypothetical protein
MQIIDNSCQETKDFYVCVRKTGHAGEHVFRHPAGLSESGDEVCVPYCPRCKGIYGTMYEIGGQLECVACGHRKAKEESADRGIEKGLGVISKRTVRFSVKYIEVYTREEAVRLARAYSCDFIDEGRKWLVGAAPDPYNNSDYRTEIHVLEGSPPQGFVVVADSRGRGEATALNISLFPVAVISWS